uniref:Reverse transcriptase domain-containing protein n=1 Tax=Tanacetum cinerariifolium TaxID=118510 RepID=A0A699KWR5_TANCI|nr:hypothetical protein [Tanacetum cinerariifolium]
MEDTMFDLVKICHHKQFLCIHDDINNLIESSLDSKLLSINSINSQRLDKKEKKVKIVEEQPAEQVAPILSTKEPEHSLSMGYEHLSITPEMKSDEVTESNAKNLLPIPIECEDIEYIDASVPDPAIVSVEEENVVHREEEEVDLEDISQVQDVVLREKLFSITRLISNIESLNDNSTPDRVPNSFESDNSLLDNFLPEFETFCDHSEETRSELLIDDSILSDELSDANFEENPLISRPPPEPPDAETNAGEEIAVVMIDKDKFDDDYQIFMFDKVFSLLSAESEDTIFDPGLSSGD